MNRSFAACVKLSRCARTRKLSICSRFIRAHLVSCAVCFSIADFSGGVMAFYVKSEWQLCFFRYRIGALLKSRGPILPFYTKKPSGWAQNEREEGARTSRSSVLRMGAIRNRYFTSAAACDKIQAFTGGVGRSRPEVYE